MREILDKIEEGILMIDKAQNIVFSNHKLQVRLGYTEAEIELKDANEIINLEGIEIETLSKEKGKVHLLDFHTKRGQNISLRGEVLIKQWEGREVYCILCKSCDGITYTREDLEEILNQIDMDIWVKDIEGNYVYINELAAFHMRKYQGINEATQLIGQKDIEVWKKPYIDNIKEVDRWVMENKRPKSYEYESIYKDEVKIISVCKSPLLDEQGEVRCITGTSKDITLKKKIQKELDEACRKFFVLNSLTDSPKTEEQKYTFLRNIQEMLISQLKANGSVIGVFDKQKGEIKHYFKLGAGKKTLKGMKDIEMSYPQFQQLLDDSNNWGVKSVESLERERKLSNAKEVRACGTRYIGCYPMIYREELVGYITFGYRDDKDLQSSEDYFIQGICNQMALLIQNCNLSQAIKEELIKRKETELELEMFLDIAADMMAVIGEEGAFLKVNSGWTKIFGWSEAELVGITWQDIIHPDDLDRTARNVKKTKEYGKIGSVINRYRCKNGDYKWVEWTSRYIEEKQVYICTTKDLTKDRQFEIERKKYQEALQIESIKNEFLSNMSHEFKTPLNIILAMMQLIDKSIEDKSIQVNEGINLNKYVQVIKQNSYRLLRLINNLIDMTKIETGYYTLNLYNHNIISVVEDITISVAQYIEDKGTSLIFDTEVEEVMLACDPDKIERIMLNLLSNATKYTSAEGEIQVNMMVNQDKVRVSVKDNGIGIPKENLKNVFDRFVQVDNALTRKCEGSGIGLSLVKSLVEMHGGEVWVESELGEGTEFIFEIPITLVTEEMPVRRLTSNPQVEKCVVEFSDIYNF